MLSLEPDPSMLEPLCWEVEHPGIRSVIQLIAESSSAVYFHASKKPLDVLTSAFAIPLNRVLLCQLTRPSVASSLRSLSLASSSGATSSVSKRWSSAWLWKRCEPVQALG